MFDFIMGSVAGFALGVAVVAIVEDAAKKDCERALPRDQVCVMVWEVSDGDK